MVCLSVLKALARRSTNAFIIAPGISEASGSSLFSPPKRGLRISMMLSIVALDCLMTSFMRSMLRLGIMVSLTHWRIWSTVTQGVSSAFVVSSAPAAGAAKAATPRERTMTSARRRLTIFFIFLQPFLFLIILSQLRLNGNEIEEISLHFQIIPCFPILSSILIDF